VLIDGGIFANNPTMCAYAEARKVFIKPGAQKKKASAEDFAILSIGTGYNKKKYDYRKVRKWGRVEWIKPMIDMMMDGVSDTVDYQVAQIYDSLDAKEQYLRIDSVLTPEIIPDFDCVDPDNLHKLKDLADDVFSANEQEIYDFLLRYKY
jgi:patatin-like phospholipase/acyl hydrolase